jgi:hypothetical protein
VSTVTSGATVTRDDINRFCRDHNVAFYRMGRPENWDDPEVFRVATHDFPNRGITVPVGKVVEWLEHPPFLGEGI